MDKLWFDEKLIALKLSLRSINCDDNFNGLNIFKESSGIPDANHLKTSILTEIEFDISLIELFILMILILNFFLYKEIENKLNIFNIESIPPSMLCHIC